MSLLQRRHFPHNINILIACAGFSGKLTQRWLSTGSGCSAAGLGAPAVLRGAVNTYCHLKERNLQENRESCCLCLCQSSLKQRVLICPSQPASLVPSEGLSHWQSRTTSASITYSLLQVLSCDGRVRKYGHWVTSEVFPTSSRAYRVL